MQLNLFSKNKKDQGNLGELFMEHIGMHGRLLSGSKSGYLERNPNSIAYFNANIIDSRGQKVWFGDLDLVADYEDLAKIVAKHPFEFLVLRESDARFGKENRNLKDLKRSAKVIISPDGIYFPGTGTTQKFDKEND